MVSSRLFGLLNSCVAVSAISRMVLINSRSCFMSEDIVTKHVVKKQTARQHYNHNNEEPFHLQSDRVRISVPLARRCCHPNVYLFDKLKLGSIGLLFSTQR